MVLVYIIPCHNTQMIVPLVETPLHNDLTKDVASTRTIKADKHVRYIAGN